MITTSPSLPPRKTYYDGIVADHTKQDPLKAAGISETEYNFIVNKYHEAALAINNISGGKGDPQDWADLLECIKETCADPGPACKLLLMCPDNALNFIVTQDRLSNLKEPENPELQDALSQKLGSLPEKSRFPEWLKRLLEKSLGNFPEQLSKAEPQRSTSLHSAQLW